MKRLIIAFILCCALCVSMLPKTIYAFSSGSGEPTDDDLYQATGALALGNMVTTGNAQDLDFSIGDQDTAFLTALGQALVTQDPSGLIIYGLDWLGEQASIAFNNVCSWAYSVQPELYNFLQNAFDLPEYNTVYSPVAGNSLAKLFRNRVSSPDPIVPQPDVNYNLYLELINGTGRNVVGTYMSDFWWYDYDRLSASFANNSYTLDLDPKQYSFIAYEYSYNVNRYNNTSYKATCLGNYQNPGYYISEAYCCEPITIYINNIENSSNYICTSSVPDPKKCLNNSNSTFQSFDLSGYYNTTTNKWSFSSIHYISSYPNLQRFQYQGTLENIFKLLVLNFRNIDIYVNGNLWSVGHYTDDDSIIYPIGIPDSFEILTGTQGAYTYPIDTYWNLGDLIDIIKTAILESGVVTYDDIAPVIVDVNRQQAVATVSIVRNDYDNLIAEQYPLFPSKYSGLNLPVTFSSESNVEAMKYIVQDSGSGLLPDDLKIILAGGAIVILIGFLLNRMLE